MHDALATTILQLILRNKKHSFNNIILCRQMWGTVTPCRLAAINEVVWNLYKQKLIKHHLPEEN